MKPMNGMIVGVALAVSALLSACAGGPETKELHATLSSSQEVPPISGGASGQATFWLNSATKQVSWKIGYTGLSSDAAAAHVHGPAAPGANAGVVVNLAPGGVKNPIEGSATLTDAQIADLLAGNDYVNIHTAQNKGGEIRGQIK
jgi:hypothetical protein